MFLLTITFVRISHKCRGVIEFEYVERNSQLAFDNHRRYYLLATCMLNSGYTKIEKTVFH